MTWERSSVVLAGGKVRSRVLKTSRQFKNHKEFVNRTPTENECTLPVQGLFDPNIHEEVDEAIGKSVKQLGIDLSLGFSEMKNSYVNFFRTILENMKPKDESKKQEGDERSE